MGGEEGKEVWGKRVCAADPLPPYYKTEDPGTERRGLGGKGGGLCSGKASRFQPHLCTLSGHGNLGVCSLDLGPTPWEWVGG